MFFDDDIKEARYFAIQIHSNSQKYDGYPYIKHLEDVFLVLIRFEVTHRPINIASFLHDIDEDGAASYNKIKQKFGYDVAEITYAVTDERGKNRKERHEKTYQKIKADLRAICLKLADMIANVEHGRSKGAKENKNSMYKKEYPHFRQFMKDFSHLENIDGLKPIISRMWNHLDYLLDYKGKV